MPIVKNLMDKEVQPTIKSFITADLASFWVLFVGAVLLPLVTFPMFGLAPDVSKKFFIFGILVVAIALWIDGRLQAGEIKLPQSIITFALPILPIAFLIAGIFSPSPKYSLVGPLYQSGTMLSILALSLLSFLIMMMFDSRKRLFNFFLTLSLVSVVVALFHILVFLIGGTFAPGIFNYLPQTLIGKWYEMSVYFGFTAIISLLMLELPILGSKRILKWLAIASLSLSVFMLALTNFIIAWLAVGLVALFTFVFSIASRTAGDAPETIKNSMEGKQIFRPSFFVLLIALLFLILGRPGGLLADGLGSVYNQLNISFVEVRPGWLSTGGVIKEVLLKDPLTGVGPSNFSSAWSIHKPRLVNEMQYWNVNFADAVGIIPTFAVTTGAVGILAWLLFIFAILYTAWQASKNIPSDPLTKFLIVSSFTGMVYFWVMSIVYTPDAFGFAFLFIMTGIFVASLVAGKTLPQLSIKFYSNPRNYFVSLLVLVLILIITIASGYLLVQRMWSVITYQKALSALSVGNVESASSNIIKAINLNNGDPLYFRVFSSVKIQELNKLLSSSEGKIEEIQPLLQNVITAAIGSSEEAVKINPSDSANIMSLGNVYEYLAGLGVTGAYEQALSTYQTALKVNKNNPEILLALARLEISQNKFTSARDYLEQALAIKSNYSSSILLLAQLDIQNTGAPAAIRRLEQAVQTITNDSGLYFQLGFLRYRSGDFVGAISAMQRVLALSPNGLNANASYFLGLAYAENGQADKAIEQFELIAKFNPDNAEVKQIIRNIRAGRDALAGVGGVNTNKGGEEENTGNETKGGDDTAKADEVASEPAN